MSKYGSLKDPAFNKKFKDTTKILRYESKLNNTESPMYFGSNTNIQEKGVKGIFRKISEFLLFGFAGVIIILFLVFLYYIFS